MNDFIDSSSETTTSASFTAAPGETETQIPVPVPVSPVPTPDTIATYGIQGVVVTLVLALGKPLIDKVYEFFSDSAKASRYREERQLEAQVRSANLIEESYKDQREFIQKAILDQSKRFEEMFQVMIKSTEKQNELMARGYEDVRNGINLDSSALKNLEALFKESNKYKEEEIVLLRELYKRVKVISAACQNRAIIE
jgi:hypothetical protein